MKVFVVDRKNKPCLPTTPRRARQLLNQKRATIVRTVPFTIKLRKTIKSPIGSFQVGVDDGAKYVGIAAKNEKTNEIVFTAQINHRQDVSVKINQRKQYRQNRRGRLRHRQPRYSNRIKKKIAPSIRQRKEVIIRVIKDLNKYLNVNNIIVEEVSFNPKEKKRRKFFSITEYGKTYLKKEIEKLGHSYSTTYGFETKTTRIALGLPKNHINDACSIVKSNKICSIHYHIKPKRTKIWENNPTKSCIERYGLRHYDLVKSKHKRYGYIVGSVKCLGAKCLTIRTTFSENFQVNYKKTVLLQRFKGLIYSF